MVLIFWFTWIGLIYIDRVDKWMSCKKYLTLTSDFMLGFSDAKTWLNSPKSYSVCFLPCWPLGADLALTTIHFGNLDEKWSGGGWMAGQERGLPAKADPAIKDKYLKS